MMAEDKVDQLDQLPPLISIRFRLASESVLLPPIISNVDALCFNLFPRPAKGCTLSDSRDLDNYVWLGLRPTARWSDCANCSIGGGEKPPWGLGQMRLTRPEGMRMRRDSGEL